MLYCRDIHIYRTAYIVSRIGLRFDFHAICITQAELTYEHYVCPALKFLNISRKANIGKKTTKSL